MKEYSKHNRIDEIFAEIEAFESAKRERYLLGACILVTALLLVFLSSLVITHNKQSALYTQVEEEKLSNESLLLYAENRTPISVPNTSSLQIERPEISTPVWTDQEEEPKVDAFSSQGIQLEISGHKIVNQELKFHILNFDPNMIYRVDFGNGQGLKVGETFTYTYDVAKTYEFKIIAYGKFNKRLKFETYLSIDESQTTISMIPDIK